MAAANVNTNANIIRYFKSIKDDDVAEVNRLLASGVDINQKNVAGIPGLHFAAMFAKPKIVAELLSYPTIDINYTTRVGTALHAAIPLSAMDKETKEFRLEIIRMLIGKGINENQKDYSNKTALKKAQDANFKEALPLLSRNMWKGLTRDEMVQLDSVLAESEQFSSSGTQTTTCPVCATIVIRDSGCYKLSHICPAITPYYHKELYEKYNSDGEISWCTLCNRIQKGYNHYKMATHDSAPPELDNICGGLSEKLIRLNAYRNAVFELQNQKNKISATNAVIQLVEKTWDAPIISPERRGRIWNVRSDLFIEKTEPIEFPIHDIPYPGEELPIIITNPSLNKTDDINYIAKGVLIEFRHISPHPLIGFDSLFHFIQSFTDNINSPTFGRCFCDTGILVYPDELQNILDTNHATLFEQYGVDKKAFQTLVNKYRILFNTKFSNLNRPVTGGGSATRRTRTRRLRNTRRYKKYRK